MNTGLKLLCFAAAFVFAAVPALQSAGQEAGKADSQPVPGDKNATSQQDQESVLRDPFWEVGYTAAAAQPTTPTNRVEKTEEEKPAEIKWPALVIKGKVKTPKGDLVHIEGAGIHGAGETISITSNNMVYKWRIESISEKGIQVVKLDVTPAKSAGSK